MSSPGDTTYVFSGQNSFTVLPNSIPNYDPSISLADTLSFTSATAGSENGIDFSVAGKFTYSLNSGYFKINNVNFSGTYTIKAINSSMVELIIISNSGGVETEGQTLFFKKK